MKLDNGVMGKPGASDVSSRQGTQQRVGKNMDFYSNIDSGDNNRGQTTIAPGQVVRGGKTVYDQVDYPNNQQGDRWVPKKRK